MFVVMNAQGWEVNTNSLPYMIKNGIQAKLILSQIKGQAREFLYDWHQQKQILEEMAFQREKQKQMIEFVEENNRLIVESEKNIKQAIRESGIMSSLTDDIQVCIHSGSSY